MKRFFTLSCIVILFILAAANSSAQSVNSIGSEKSRSKTSNDTVSKVEMHSFDLAQTANTVKINWQTSMEIRHNYFEIQRSVDGVNYEVIALMFAMEDAEKGAAYKYHDHLTLNQPAGEIYYRLRLVDLNGKSFTLSPKKIRNQQQSF
jgi:hypothetical protein